MKELADDAAHETHRQKHSNDGKGGGQHGQANFLGAVHRCLKGCFAHQHVPHNVFTHHDRIVNQQANTQRQRHQRDVVDGETKQVHEQKRADDRDR